jgi:hypothetical protein
MKIVGKLFHLYKIVFFFICFIVTQNALAQSTWLSHDGGGDFTNNSIWWENSNGTGAQPTDVTSGDVFIIENGDSVRLDDSSPIISSLTVQNGGIFHNTSHTLDVAYIGSGGSFTVANGGTYHDSLGTIKFRKALGSSPTFTLQISQDDTLNNITLEDGPLTISASGVLDTISISGTLKIADGAGSITTSTVTLAYLDDAIIEYALGADYSIGAEWTTTLNAASVTINSLGDTISTSGNRTLRKTLALTAGTIDLGSNNTLTVLGDLSGDVSGTGIIHDNITLSMGNGAGSTQVQTITGTISLKNLDINKSGGSGGTEGAANTVTCSGQLLFSSEGTLDIIAGTLKFGSAGRIGSNITTLDVTVSSGGALHTGGQELTTLDNLTATNGKIKFDGSSGSENLPTGTIADVEIENNSGVLTSSGTLTIGTNLNLTNGTITSTSTNILQLGGSASVTATPSGFGTTRMIKGPLVKQSLSGSYTFPVGSGTTYRSVDLTVNTGTGNVTVQYTTTNPNVGNTPDGIKSISNNRKWTITPGGTISDFDVTLEYTDPGFAIGDESNMRILRGTSGSSNWVDVDPNASSGSGSVTAAGLTSLTPTDYTVAEAVGAYTWSGLDPGNNNVNDPDNWTGGVVPGAGDDVTIGTGTADINVATTWGKSTINGGATVNITVDATPALTLDDGSSADVLTVSGSGTSLNATPSTLTTAGQVIRLEGQGQIRVSDQASIEFSNSNNSGIEDGTGSALATSRQSYATGTSYIWNANGSAFQSQTYGNLSLNPTSAISVAGFTAINDMQINGQTITITSGTLTIGEDLAITAGTLSLAANVDLSGDLSVAGTLSASSGTFAFEGSTGQQGISGGGTVTFYDLDMDNGNGLGLSRNITVSNTLNFAADGLITTGSNTITIGSGGSASGASGSRYISGIAAKVFPTGSSSFTFPTGKGGEYLPLTMQLGSVSGSTVTVTVEQQNTTPPNHTSVSGLNHISTIRYWDLTRSGSGTVGSHQVTLSYNENDAVDTDRLSLRVAQWNSANWVSLGGQGTGVPTGTIASTLMAGFGAGMVTFGDAVGDNSLPVELSSFTAKASFKEVSLRWKTFSELENQGFYLYRRQAEIDVDWTQINQAIIQGQGNTSQATEYEFIDRSAAGGNKYEYMLESISYAGVRVQEKVIEVDVPVPANYALLGNYPNPFNPTTNIRFQLPEKSEVTLKIYDMRGNLVDTPALKNSFDAGEHDINWNAQNNSGSRVASGMYIYLFQAGKFQKTGKMVLLK